MKKILTIAATLSAAILMTTSALAQQAGPRGGQGRPGGEQMQERRQKMEKIEKDVLKSLNLTTAQQKQIDALKKSRQKKTQELRSKAQNGDRQALRGEMQKIQKDFRDGMKKIMGEQKYKVYTEKLQAAMKKEFGDRAGRRGGGQRGGGQRGGSTGGGF